MTASRTEPAPPTVDSKHVFSSARWLALGQLITQVVRFGVTIVLAHLIAPAEFGLVTMAGTFTALAWLFATLGTGPVLVQRRELSETLLRSLAFLGIAVGFALSLLLAALAPQIARFYGEPQVAWIVLATGSSFAISSFGLVPDGLLQRDLRFSRLVIIETVQLLSSSLLTIVLALAGWGVWALVTGNLFSVALRSAALLASSPWRLRLGFDAPTLREVSGFSGSVLAFNVLQYGTRYTDRLLIGRTLGATNLGYYEYAYRFYMYPLEVITAVIMRLMFPTFARMQEDLDKLGRAFLRTCGAIALMAFPLMAGLAAVADPFVRVILGEQWAPIIPLIQILAPLAMLHALGAMPGQLFLASGRAALRFWWSVIYTTIIVTAVAVGIRWGIKGVAAAYAIVMGPIIVVAFWLALRMVKLNLGALWMTLRQIIIAALSMAALVTALQSGLVRLGLPLNVVLVTAVAAGAACYVWLVRWLRPVALDDLYRLLPESVRVRSAVSWLFAVPGAHRHSSTQPGD